MRVIGVTGGIGSGKSLVTKIMKENFGAGVIDTDSIGHRLLLKGEKAYEKVIEVFGEKFLEDNGEIDRKKLGELVFSDQKKLKELNAILHPLVEEVVDAEIEAFQKRGYSFVCLETALLIEVGYQRKCTEVWFVSASKEIRMKRLKKNRGMSEEKAEMIFEKQKSEEDFKTVADRVIDNSKEEKEIENQIREIVSSYQRRSE